MSATPELDKMHAVIESGANDVLTEFYDWLTDTKGYEIGEWVQPEGYHDSRFVPVHTHPEELLAEFFGIDLKKIETERRAILEELRNR